MPDIPPQRVDSVALSEGISPSHVLGAVRRNQSLFLLIAATMLAFVSLLLLRTLPEYTARGVIRMASERRNLTSGVEDAPQAVDRPTDPVLSAVQVLTSRSMVGSVVDSLGLRLAQSRHSTPTPPGWAADFLWVHSMLLRWTRA